VTEEEGRSQREEESVYVCLRVEQERERQRKRRERERGGRREGEVRRKIQVGRISTSRKSE